MNMAIKLDSDSKITLDVQRDGVSMTRLMSSHVDWLVAFRTPWICLQGGILKASTQESQHKVGFGLLQLAQSRLLSEHSHSPLYL